MAVEYARKGIDFVFVYVREAHPGENYPALRSMEQKLTHAQAFREHFHVQRQILVDDLPGTGHRLYGELPNMTYLVSRGGKVLFRADWTDPPTIRWALDYVLASRKRRREGLRLAPFYAELTGMRWNDPSRFEEGLERNGPQAIEDWRLAVQRWSQAGPAAGTDNP